MKKISPSILSADFFRLGEQIKIIEDCKADYLHIDVMDGFFVPSISFGMPVIKTIRKSTDMFFDVHLMVSEPIRYIDDFIECGADLICVHYEACEDVRATLEHIKMLGAKVGIALKPATPVSVVKPLLDIVDLILVMSVEPGFGGQKFITSSFSKLEEAKNLVKDMDNPPEIEVDGGVCFENVDRILEAGADVLVAGSSVFKNDIKENITKFQKIMSNYND